MSHPPANRQFSPDDEARPAAALSVREAKPVVFRNDLLLGATVAYGCVAILRSWPQG